MAELETDTVKKLKAKRAAIDARLRQEQQKLNEAERKKETRRLILWGRWASRKAKLDNDFASIAMAELKSYVTRKDERALLGFPPLPDAKKEERPEAH
jgi:hypothetical protein